MGVAYVARLALLVGGLVLIGAGDWRPLLAALAGIIAARTLIVRRVLPPGSAAVSSLRRFEI